MTRKFLLIIALVSLCPFVVSNLNIIKAIPSDPQSAIKMSEYVTCAIDNNGGVKCWGRNDEGEIGDNTSGTDRLVPTQVYGLTSGVKAIATGGLHTCALLDSGAVECWGSNAHGQIGDGTSGTNRLVPTQVNGLTSGVKAIAASYSSTCALLESGAVECWGGNANGQVGDNTSGTDRLLPTQVSGLTSGVKAIAAYNSTTCALLESGAVKCWGFNGSGQVGDNTSGNNRLVPTQVSGLTSNVIAISIGSQYACAILSSGGVKCWGSNSYGQIGDGTSGANRLVPTQVSGLTSGAVAITTSNYHVCVVLDTGSVECWGNNQYGQIGDPSIYLGLQKIPVQLASFASGVQAIAAGGYRTCVLLSSGSVSCWGLNNEGAIGDGTTGSDNTTPQQVQTMLSGVSMVTTGGSHTCALLNSGAVKCWGSNSYGQLGNNSTDSLELPVQVSGLESGVIAIAAGSNHTCALLDTGAVKCWGYNSDGEIGDNTSGINRLVPTQVYGLTSGVSSITAGGRFSCALLSSGAEKCWGSNSDGQIGDNTTGTNRLVPTQVSGLTGGVQAITAGFNHACAVLSSGAEKCWGANNAGQIGDNTISTDRLVPTQVSGLTSGVQKTTAGSSHTCALLSSGAVKCWGSNYKGQIGDNTQGDNTTATAKKVPTQVYGLTSGVSALLSGNMHNCVLLNSGAVKCWGDNSYGQIGNDTSSGDVIVPTQVTGLTSGVTAIAIGSSNADHACATLTGGNAVCWGSNGSGQLASRARTLIQVMSDGVILGYKVIADTVPVNLKVTLASDGSVDVTSKVESGTQLVAITNSAKNRKLAEININFSEDLDFSLLTADTSGTKAFLHVPEGINKLPGVPSDGTYSLYIPKGSGDKVWICPGVGSLESISLSCGGGYYLAEGQTSNGATASVVSEGPDGEQVTYWKVSGLTGTGGMSVITGLQDQLSRLAAAVNSDHTITFGTNFGLTVGTSNTMTIVFKDFDLTNIQISDITLTDNTDAARSLAISAGPNTWGVTIDKDSKELVFSVPTSGTGGYDASSQIVIKIGTNTTGGVNQIINPGTTGTYYETLTINNSVGEEGMMAVPIVDSDQVNVTGYVNTFINFDIDTGTTDTDCAYNTCLNHSGGTSAANYVVDLGELNSTWVNKSESTSIMHSDGNNGAINSIYFDLTTNAYNGAVLYVKSANGGLQGPATNLIPSVTDGSNIQANDGAYGFQLTDTGSGNGTIVRNSNCTMSTAYCGLSTSEKEVFTTNSKPLDNGRLRMDLAAASSYVNNPGNYTDTLTFLVTATY